MTTNRSTYGKASSRPRKPAGLYHATVTNVDGVDVYVEVPRLTLDFEYGPIPYSGDVPEIGDEVYVGFLEGSQDDVVGIFPGGGGGGAGPIEPTFFVCSSTERQELKDVADYVDGIDTEAIATACAALPVGGGKVQLSAGRFVLPKPDYTYVNLPDDSTLEGVGPSTILEVNAEPSGWQYGLYLGNQAQVRNLTIDFGNNVNTRLYGIYADGDDCLLEGVHFTGMDESGAEDLYYALLDYESKAVNCVFKGLSNQIGGG